MRRECRERFSHYSGLAIQTCITAHVPWCMPGSLTSGFLSSRWWGKRSRHSWCMRNRQLYVSGKRPMHEYEPFACQASQVVVTMLTTAMRTKARCFIINAEYRTRLRKIKVSGTMFSIVVSNYQLATGCYPGKRFPLTVKRDDPLTKQACSN